jgi:hypothetical protein
MKCFSVLFSFLFIATIGAFVSCRRNKIIASQRVREKYVFLLRHVAHVTAVFYLVVVDISYNREILRAIQKYWWRHPL